MIRNKTVQRLRQWFLIGALGCLCAVFGKTQVSALFQQDSLTVEKLLGQANSTNDRDSLRYFLDEALELSRQLSYDTGTQKALQKLSLFERENNNTSVALRYALQALNYLEVNKNPDLYYEALMYIGNIYQDENLDAKAKSYYQEAALLLGEDPENERKIDLFRKMGLTHFKLNEMDSALIYYQNLVKVFGEKADTNGIIQSYQDVVDLYIHEKQYQEALTYNLEIKKLVEANADRRALAIAQNNIGYSYNLLKRYEQAISYFKKTEELCKSKAYVNMVELYTNMGITYNNQGYIGEAIDYLQKATSLLNAQKGKEQEKAYLDNLIATVYLGNRDVYNAILYNEDAMRTAKSGNNFYLLSECYKTAAEAHEDLYAYEIALDYYQKHLTLRDSFRLEERLRQQDLLQQQLSLERAEKEISLLLINQEVQELAIRQLGLEKSKLELESDKLRLEANAKEDELALLKTAQDVREANLKNKELETQRAQQELVLIEQRLQTEKKDHALQELRQTEQLKQLEQDNLERQNEVLLKDKDILMRDKKLLTQEQELNRSELERQHQFRQFAYGLGALLFLILIMILSGLFYSRIANQKLAKQNSQIEKQKEEIEQSHDEVEKERHKSEALLLNILPAEMAMELKEKGGATPRQYEKVSVLFSDFSGFTRIAESMSPQALIEELNICFRAFDEIVESHNLEKIKTIGDAYMCAGGIPVPNDSNPSDAVAAALEMQVYMNARILEKRAQGLDYWNMRIGIHTGEIIAGVVGIKRFAYDIWGDTVNVASRLESSSEIGKINISGDTYELVKDNFSCTYRGEVAVKHKGEISMYFVENAVG